MPPIPVGAGVTNRTIAGFIAIVVCLLALVCFLMWVTFQHAEPAKEVVAPAAAARQSDNSVVLERIPEAAPNPPPHRIPRNATEVRRTHVTVAPRQPDCEPVSVDLSLVRDGDGGQRVIASSPDGEVVGGVDVPITPALIVPEPKRWAAGLSYAPGEKSGGVWIDRDIARVRLGAELVQQDGGISGRVRVGITF